MKFSEDVLNTFNLNEKIERMPVSVMKVEEILQYMKSSADRIVIKSEKYAGTKDADAQLDCMDIVTVKLNDFAQSFKDIVIF